MEEVWKAVNGYVGLYEVSNLGSVRSLDRLDSIGRPKKGKMMKDKFDYANYKVVGLTKDEKQKVLKVHRLVAEAFILDFESKNELGYHVDHIDGDKSNNQIGNLQMLTHYDNCFKRTGSNAIQKIKAINIETNEELIFNGQNEASRLLGINQGNISNVLRGKCKSTGGYKFIKINH